MGRIRTKWVKNISEELVKKYPDKFGKDFESNKKAVDELKIAESKPLRNKVAGYVVKVVKNKKF